MSQQLAPPMLTVILFVFWRFGPSAQAPVPAAAMMLHGDISYVILRHQMSVSHKPMLFHIDSGAADIVIGQFTRRARIDWLQSPSPFGNRQMGPLIGPYTYLEALDVLLKNSGCTWYPLTERYIRFECETL